MATTKTKAATGAKSRTNGHKAVLVRTYSAGVHYGYLLQRDGKEVTLGQARRIWSWRGANTLNEIALRGVGQGSKISEPATEVVLTEAIEVIACTPKATENIEAARWG